jgi:hypothetical protein
MAGADFFVLAEYSLNIPNQAVDMRLFARLTQTAQFRPAPGLYF